MVFERVPAYCNLCRHLGHYADGCYVSNSRLRKPQQPASDSQTTGVNNKRKMSTFA